LHAMRGVKAVAMLLVASLLAPPLAADADESREGPSAVCETPPVVATEFSAIDDAPVATSEVVAGWDEAVQEKPQEPAPPKEPPPKRLSLRPKDFWRDVKVEAKRYVADSFAIVTAPIHWNVADWERFGGVALLVGGLMLADETIDREVQQNRSRFTDRVSDATTGFGGAFSTNVGVGFLAVGYLLRDWDLRETGRETLEAGFLAHLLDKWVLKRAFGRERPIDSNGETVLRPGSVNDSFPSGHATQAFSVASVIAIRARGWLIPTLAHTAATLVAFDRVNDRVHFASDVAAGAVLGTAVGRFIVNRHKRAQGQKPAADINLVPIPGGLSVRLVF